MRCSSILNLYVLLWIPLFIHVQLLVVRHWIPCFYFQIRNCSLTLKLNYLNPSDRQFEATTDCINRNSRMPFTRHLLKLFSKNWTNWFRLLNLAQHEVPSNFNWNLSVKKFSNKKQTQQSRLTAAHFCHCLNYSM